MKKTAKIIRNEIGVVATLSTPRNDIVKQFIGSELRQERRQAMCWIEKTGRDTWGSYWSLIEKQYEV